MIQRYAHDFMDHFFSEKKNPEYRTLKHYGMSFLFVDRFDDMNDFGCRHSDLLSRFSHTEKSLLFSISRESNFWRSSIMNRTTKFWHME